VHALADHARGILPTVLGALDASRYDAEAQVAHLLSSLHGVTDREVDPGTAPTAPAAPETPEVVDLRDTPGPASAGPSEQPRRVVGKHRLLVAGLVPAPGQPTDRR
jgi:hypothetical protein